MGYVIKSEYPQNRNPQRESTQDGGDRHHGGFLESGVSDDRADHE